MRRTVKGRAQSARLVLESIEHVIDGNRERIEFIVSPHHREPAAQIPLQNALAGACYSAHTPRQLVAEPETGQRRGQRGESDSPQHREAELLREALPLRDIRSHEQVVAARQRSY